MESVVDPPFVPVASPESYHVIPSDKKPSPAGGLPADQTGQPGHEQPATSVTVAVAVHFSNDISLGEKRNAWGE